MSLWHRLAHRLGWNKSMPYKNGYLCLGCGKYTRWTDRV